MQPTTSLRMAAAAAAVLAALQGGVGVGAQRYKQATLALVSIFFRNFGAVGEPSVNLTSNY